MSNVLVLKPGQRKLDYAFFTSHKREPALAKFGIELRSAQNDQAGLKEMLAEARAGFIKTTGAAPQAIGVRGTFGGPVFAKPVVVTPEAMAQIQNLVPHAPLHMPLLLKLLDACGECFAGAPVVLMFETAFFAGLPAKEQLYALEPELSASLDLRRYGYHGLYHEAACLWEASRRLAEGSVEPGRILSVCLEPRPEIAAVLGQRPVMVTSGVTPLEGLPGETNCGEIDPSLVLILAQKKNWGPEEINLMLTQKSGLLGLADRPCTFEELFRSESSELTLAREIVLYHMLCACGAGMAALGGLDTIVFSGRYAKLSAILGPALSSKLRLKQNIWHCYEDSLFRIVADKTEATLSGALAKSTA